MSLTVAFLGHGSIAPGCLERVIEESGFGVRAVFTHAPARPVSGEDNRELARLAARAGCPVIEVTGVDGLRARLEELAPDLVVCAGFMKILPPSVLSIPPLGCVNVHGALLPKYRGRAPLSRALMNGENAVGVTVHYMDEGVDSGDIILQARIKVSIQDDARTLFEKVKKLSPSLLVEALKKFRQEGPERAPKGVPQTDTGCPPFGKITPEDCVIRWDDSAVGVHNRVRALVRPYPGAFTRAGGTKYFVWKIMPIGKGTGDYRPGEVIQKDSRGTVVGTGDGCVLVQEVEAEGGEPSQPDWEVGQILG